MNRVTEYMSEYLDLLRKGSDIETLAKYLHYNGLINGHWSRRDKIANSFESDIILLEVFGKARFECVLGFSIGNVDSMGIIVDDLYGKELYVHPNYRDTPDPKWPPMGTFKRISDYGFQQTPKNRHNVFLCHASENKKEVRNLFDKLLSDGIYPWLDEIDLMPGDNWEQVITRAIKACQAVIVCLSPQAVEKIGFVQKEIRFALDRADEFPEGKIFIIPVLFETCAIPDRLKKWQYVDLSIHDGYKKLVTSIKRL